MMTEQERLVVRERFRKLLQSPAIQNSLNLRQKCPNVPRMEETKSGLMKMPSPERVDAIIKVCRSSCHYI